MAKQTVSAIVRKVADKVREYANLAERQDSGRKLVAALSGVASAIGESVTFTFNGDEVTLIGQTFTEWAEALKVDNADLMALSVEVNNGIVKVKGYVEDDLLNEADSDVATQTLTLWEQVRGSRKSPASGARAQGERITQADTPFPVYSSCDICDKVVVRGGERTYKHDWNSLRHFTQKHAVTAHGSNGFTNLVSDAWREAKEAFISGNVDEFHIPPDSDLPGFTLVAHK